MVDGRSGTSADLRFQEPWYVQHAVCEGRGKHSIRYHSPLFPESHNLPDVIASSYELSIGFGLEKAAGFSEEGLDQQEGVLDGDVVMGGRSNKSSDSEDSESELPAFVLEPRSVRERE